MRTDWITTGVFGRSCGAMVSTLAMAWTVSSGVHSPKIVYVFIPVQVSERGTGLQYGPSALDMPTA